MKNLPRLLLLTEELNETPLVTSQRAEVCDQGRTHRRVLVLGKDSSDDCSFLRVRRHHALVEVLAEHWREVVHVLETKRRFEEVLVRSTQLNCVCRCRLLPERINPGVVHAVLLCLMSADTPLSYCVVREILLPQ